MFQIHPGHPEITVARMLFFDGRIRPVAIALKLAPPSPSYRASA